MRIALIDPFYDTSHKKWAEGFVKYSQHKIDIYAESPHHWKWKMTGGAIPMTRKLNGSTHAYDLLLLTDMINLPLFKSLLNPKHANTPIALYFHENQITYPWSPDDPDIKKKRDFHYGFINYTSALVADTLFFNSKYHMESFNKALPRFLNKFPNHGSTSCCKQILQKSSVLPLGLELPKYKSSQFDVPVFIWNHRWEYDKNPDLFFNSLFQLKSDGVTFKLVVLGKSYKKSPPIFEKARMQLSEEIIHFGFADSREEYYKLLDLGNILLVTSIQDFFGISTVEGIATGAYPIVPDRLAFREHIPADYKGIYKNDRELLRLLYQIIDGRNYLNTKQFSQYVQKYDWKNLIDVYDKVFKEFE